MEILPGQSVTKTVVQDGFKMIATEGGDGYCAKGVLLTPGSTCRRLNVPGEEDFIADGIHFCATSEGPFYRGQQLLVVGGGNSGVEEGLFLTKFANKVTVLELRERLDANQILQYKEAGNPQMESDSTPPRSRSKETGA